MLPGDYRPVRPATLATTAPVPERQRPNGPDQAVPVRVGHADIGDDDNRAFGLVVPSKAIVVRRLTAPGEA